jgi:hypothetical protein
LAYKLGQLFIDGAAVPDGQDTNDLSLAIERIDDAVALDPILRESFEFPLQGLARGGPPAQGAECSLDASFHLRREMPDNLGNVRRYLRPIPGH